VYIGNYLNSLPDNISKYVIVNQNGVAVPYPNGLPVAAQTPMFIERATFGKIRSTYLRAEDIDNIKIESNSVIIPLQNDDALFEKLSQKFPNNQIIKTDNFWVFKIN
jgi:hypothetical protein